jgi:hypothetical protein
MKFDFVGSAARSRLVFQFAHAREQQYHSVADAKTLHRTPEFLSERVTTRVRLS